MEALQRLALERPVDRKLVVAPTFGGGRELLHRLALKGRGWIGFEVTTPRPLALRVALGHKQLIRVEIARGELHAIRAVLFPALKATPSVPHRMGEGGSPVSPAELARGLTAFPRRTRVVPASYRRREGAGCSRL